MKITNPQIQVINHVGQVGTKSFSPTDGINAARLAYGEGAYAMAQMFIQAIESGDAERVFELAQATKKTSFYEY